MHKRAITTAAGILAAATLMVGLPATAQAAAHDEQIIFDDVDNRTPHVGDIGWMAESNISTGWKEGNGTYTYRPMDTVKRQDMAAFLKRLAAKSGRDRGVTPKTDFTDVNAATPHCQEVQWLDGSGISQGYRNANGSWRFGGMISVYRQDMAAFMHRFANLFGAEGRIFVEDRSGYWKVTPAVAAKYENKWVVDQPATTKGTPIYSKVWVPGSGHWVKR